MGRPPNDNARRPVPRPAGLDRRGFFQRSGGAAAALAAAPALALAAAAAPGSRFRHGVASGDPLTDRVILWTRVTPPSPVSVVEVQWLVATDPALSNVVLRGTTKTNPSRDYTVKVDPVGLRPGTTYYYRFAAGGEASPVGRTRTLPTGTPERLRMAVVSCSNYDAGYFNAYARVAERADLDLVVHLGDYLYEYRNGAYGSVRAPAPDAELVTLADYRARHAAYKSDPDAQALHRQHPMVAIWDDHETANNAWTDGAENHDPATQGPWAARVAAALQAYYEWMPARVVDTAQRRRNQRVLPFGDLADLVMLEQRLDGRSRQIDTTSAATPFGPGFRQSDPGFADPARQMLGADEEAWLADRLRTTPARWKLLGQGVMFAQLKGVAAANAAGGGVFLNSDQWDGYQPARDRLYAVLKGDAQHPPVSNVAVLTGDIHSSWAADLTPDPNNPDVAAGGYDPASGAGARAVEFVGTSVTSPGVDSDTGGQIAGFLRAVNPHFKYVNLHRRGYLLVDVTRPRVVAEWWHVQTVATPNPAQSLAAAFQVADGENRLRPATPTTPRASPPALAP